MGSLVVTKPHIVCIPFPAQGHINPIFTLAKLLHHRGFYITFVHTEYNYSRLLASRGPGFVKGVDDFRFETISDGLPIAESDRTQDIPTLCHSIRNNCYPHFLALLEKLNCSPGCPPVSAVVCDGVMSITMRAAEELGIPAYVFYTPSGCGLMCYLHYSELIQKGYIPLKDESCFTNGYLDTEINFIAGMSSIRIRDLPSFVRTTDIDDVMLNYDMMNASNARRAKGIILNTFDELEKEVLDAMRTKFSLQTFTIGPLSLIRRQLSGSPSDAIGSNLWKEDTTCLDWLDKRDPRSVVYVNFGSITVVTEDQWRELAWGVSNSKHYFLWIARPDLVKGEKTQDLFNEFLEGSGGRGLLAGWCPQEEVLSHPSVGCFLTHSGWNSTLESISSGVPMICWPFFAEQHINCLFSREKWGVGMEIGGGLKREEVERLVREVMEGEKGEEMRGRAMEWKQSAEEAAKEGGSSYKNLDKLISQMLG